MIHSALGWRASRRPDAVAGPHPQCLVARLRKAEERIVQRIHCGPSGARKVPKIFHELATGIHPARSLSARSNSQRPSRFLMDIQVTHCSASSPMGQSMVTHQSRTTVLLGWREHETADAQCLGYRLVPRLNLPPTGILASQH